MRGGEDNNTKEKLLSESRKSVNTMKTNIILQEEDGVVG